MVATYNIAPEVGRAWRPLLLDESRRRRADACRCLGRRRIRGGGCGAGDECGADLLPAAQRGLGIGYCADGGLFANNPSLFALNSVISRKNPVSTIYMLSLGTGSIAQRVGAVADPLAWGVGQWLLPRQTSSVPQLPLLQTLMDGQEQIADAQCAKMLRSRYMRVDLPLSAMFPLDDLQSIPAMVKETQDYIDGKTSRGVPPWQDVVNWVQDEYLGVQPPVQGSQLVATSTTSTPGGAAGISIRIGKVCPAWMVGTVAAPT